jgi:hypothetical protein
LGCTPLFARGVGGVFRLWDGRWLRFGLAGLSGGAALLPAFFFFQVLIELLRQAASGLVFGVDQQGSKELAGEADGDIVDDALEVRR